MNDRLKNIFFREFQLSYLKKFSNAYNSFSLTEKVAFAIFGLVFIITSTLMVKAINEELSVLIPADGGSLVEGVIGTPRFINPLLAISDADRDMTELIYSGLLKPTPEGGLVTNLAEYYLISDDGLEYTFKIRDDATFHDGKPVTADDVIFTIKKAVDPVIKSPKRPNWEGAIVEKVDEKTVKIVLKQKYSPFLENATIGILPSHIWGAVESEQFAFSQFNSEPIGSGPYKLEKIDRNKGGLPTAYHLRPFENFVLGKPHIDKLVIRFYSGEGALLDAFENGEIESIGAISPQKAAALKSLGRRIETAALPRIFGVFFNQDQARLFTQREVRIALNNSVDRNRIVNEIFKGYGKTINGPIPLPFVSHFDISTTSATSQSPEEIRAYLEKNGWKANPETGIYNKKTKTENLELSFSISTSNVDELKETAKILKENWEQIGAKVEIKLFDTSDLNQNIIRPRKYDALLFGEVVGRELDLFAFWHSSQRNDPGLNIALYANITADKALEEGRKAASLEERMEAYERFAREVDKDIPAVFTHSPDYIYVVPAKIKGLTVGAITLPSERFIDVHLWHTNTDRVWKVFAN